MDYLALSNTEAKASSLATVVKDIININGKKYTTGTVTFATAISQPTITHNLGSIPSVFFMIAKNVQGEFTFNAENRPPAGLYGYAVYGYFVKAPSFFKGKSIQAWSWKGNGLEWRNNNVTKLDWFQNVVDNSPATDTQIQLTYRSNTCVYLANQEYEWVAIE